MLKHKTFITFFCLIFSVIFVLSGCSSKDARTTVFESEFENGNQEIFTTFGQVLNLEEGVSLVKGEENIGPLTYFGRNDTKNTFFPTRGLAVEITMQVGDDLNLGDAFDWNVVLNNKQSQPMATITLSFKKYLDALRFGFSSKTGENANASATNIENKNSKFLQDNQFILEVSIYSDIEDEARFTVLIKDMNKKVIYQSEGNYLLNSADEKIKAKEIFGLRSLGLSYMSIDKVIVKKLRVLEN